jgi:hypothetical protein
VVFCRPDGLGCVRHFGRWLRRRDRIPGTPVDHVQLVISELGASGHVVSRVFHAVDDVVRSDDRALSFAKTSSDSLRSIGDLPRGPRFRALMAVVGDRDSPAVGVAGCRTEDERAGGTRPVARVR